VQLLRGRRNRGKSGDNFFVNVSCSVIKQCFSNASQKSTAKTDAYKMAVGVARQADKSPIGRPQVLVTAPYRQRAMKLIALNNNFRFRS
jgi:hypothetical protein